MELPTIDKVHELWDEHHVPNNVRKHSEQVAKVAVFLAKKLKEKGIHVDVGLAERSALLHDMTRSANFEDPEKHPEATMEDIDFWKQLKEKYGEIHHGESAADLLQDKYPEVAEVIRGHTIDNVKDSLLDGTWEMKILSYSDNRVVHDRIVSFKGRVEDARKRHGYFYDKLKKETGIDYFKICMGNIKKVEKEIFEKLDITPEDVNNID
jgi:putative nucleotidyltransferase with HDIG domain